MSPTLEEANMRNEVVGRIKEVIQELWPEAKVRDKYFTESFTCIQMSS